MPGKARCRLWRCKGPVSWRVSDCVRNFHEYNKLSFIRFVLRREIGRRGRARCIRKDRDKRSGALAKLPCGGGVGVCHSRVVACHGLSEPAGLPCLMLQKKLMMKGICARPRPNRRPQDEHVHVHQAVAQSANDAAPRPRCAPRSNWRRRPTCGETCPPCLARTSAGKSGS